MLIVTETTIANRGVLETRGLPKKFFGRVFLLPRGAGLRVWARLVLEIQVLRYLATLAPLVGLAFASRDLALPILQAPLAMLVLIAAVELRVLRLSKPARARLLDADEAARRLDRLAFRARACLRGIAARHGIQEGKLHLVVEQSELARVPPLTLVSVQTDRPEPHRMALTPEDMADLRARLFDADLTEGDLLAVNHRDEVYIRDIAQEARAVSAHARLAAYLGNRAAA